MAQEQARLFFSDKLATIVDHSERLTDAAEVESPVPPIHFANAPLLAVCYLCRPIQHLQTPFLLLWHAKENDLNPEKPSLLYVSVDLCNTVYTEYCIFPRCLPRTEKL